MFKKCLSVLLVFMMIVSLFTVIPVSSSAATVDEAAVGDGGYVSYNMYSAQVYANCFNLGHQSMAREYYNSLKGDSLFMASVGAWKTAHVVASPSYTLDMGEINMKDYYKTVIFDLLAQENSDSGLDTFLKMATNKETSYAVGVFKSIAKAEDLTDEEINSLTPEQAAILTEKTGIYKALKGTGIAMKIAGWAKDAKEVYDAFAKYQTISDLKDGTEQLLTMIANDANNPEELRAAARDCIHYFGEGYQKTLNQLAGGTVSVAKFTWDLIADTSLNWAWDMIAASITTAGGTPIGMAVLGGLKGGRVLSNYLFSTDKEVEAFYKLEAAVDFEDSIIRISNNLSTGDFKHSDSDAYIYLEAIKLYEKTILLGFDYVEDMLKMAGNSTYNQATDFLFGKYSECQALLLQNSSNKSRTENFYKTFEEMVFNGYKTAYYPDFDSIISGVNSDYIQTESLSLSQKAELHVGDNGFIDDFINTKYTPSNYTALFTENWTSSDESIIKFDHSITYNNGMFECLSQGSCTVTCTTSDGLSESIVVVVGNPVATEEHDYYSDFEYSVNDDGKTATLTNYTGSSSYVLIPSSINGYIINRIESNHYDNRLTSVFHGNSISQIGIPNSVVYIGENAFRELRSLISINIPNSVKVIEKNAFRDCSLLSNVTISEGIEEIGESSFYGCSSIRSVTLPNSMAIVSSALFSKCSSLSSISLGNNIKKISTNAFSDCSSLKEIVIPDSVNEIESAFDNCISLESIWFPANAKYSETTYSFHPSNISNVHITKGDGDNHDMDETLGCWVDSLLYDSKETIRNVVICDGVTSIGSGAFCECESLNSVSIPESVVTIESLAFALCTNLNELHLPSKLKTIGATAFSYCNSLAEIVIPDSVETIEIWAFANCANLKTITIPVSCVIEEKECFEDTYPSTILFTKGLDGYFPESKIINATITVSVPWCYKKGYQYLEAVYFDEGIYNVPTALFYQCTSLSHVELPSTLKEIGNYAFCKCSNLSQIVLPEGTEKLGTGCFARSGLKSIVLPESITDAGKGTFFDCESLTTAIIDAKTNDLLASEDFTYYLYEYEGGSNDWSAPYGFFEKCYKLNTVEYDNSSLKNIGDYAFDDCRELNSFTISNSIQSIGKFAFAGSGLSSVYIPENVNEISYCALGFDNDYSGSKSNSFTIYGKVDTVAHKYSNDYAFDFIAEKPNDITDRGFCNKLTTWEYYEKNHSLRLYGYIDDYTYGYVSYRNDNDYSGETPPPWSQYVDDIEIVELCDGVKSTDYNSFKNHTSLKTVILSPSVYSLGSQTFLNCKELETVIVRGDSISLGGGTFYNCENLKDLGDTEKFKRIADRDFYNCKSLTSFVLSDKITSLNSSTFEGCESLKSINLSGVSYLHDCAFKDCKALNNIQLSDSLTSIGYHCFQGCSSLGSICIPNNHLIIEDEAFCDCVSLEEITIPNEIYYIGNSAFNNTAFYNNESFWEDNVLYCDNWLLKCKNSSSKFDVIIKDSTVGIAEYAFYNCDNLTEVIIPSTVKSVCDRAFDDCDNLDGIIIPDSVDFLGSDLVVHCSNMSYIYYPKYNKNPLYYMSFFGTKITHVFYGGSQSDYDNSVWSSFSNISFHYDINPTEELIEIVDYKEPDCTNNGGYKIKCLLCEEIIGERTLYASHIYSKTVVPPNCTERGYDLYKCDRCGSEFKSNYVNSLGHDYMDTIMPPLCSERGYTLHKCSRCDNEYKDSYTDMIPHELVDGICTMCGKSEDECIESAHPYENNTDKSWTIHKDGAKRIALTFSEETKTESGWDYIYLYNASDEQVGRYTGTELAGKRIVVKGDTVRIRLTSDSSSNYYGFSFDKVQAFYDDCTHPETEIRNARDATCGNNGYTGDTYCLECGDKINEGEVIPATGQHTMIDVAHEATCGSGGYIHHYCDVCGYSYDDNYTEPTGLHQYDDGVCTVCGKVNPASINSVITPNEDVTAEIINSGKYRYYKFTPDINGTIIWYSLGDSDTYGYLYDSDMNELSRNDDGGNGSNFSITYTVEANKTYILACRFYSSERTGEFTVRLDYTPDKPATPDEPVIPDEPYTITDDETGVSLTLKDDASLSVAQITDTDDINSAALHNRERITLAYDIQLLKDGNAIQPTDMVTVKIPYENADAKVYRVEDDNSFSNMNAVYQDGYFVFNTDHFSVYVITEEVPLILGDADGDGEVTSIDVTLVQRNCAYVNTGIDENILMNADVDGNGELEIIDATYIQRYLAYMPTPYNIGEAIS